MNVAQAVVVETTPILVSTSFTEVGALPRRAKNEREDMSQLIGETLASLRKQRGFTQVELAERLGVSQNVVSEYERGKSRLTAPMIVQIAELLGVSSDELLGLKANKTKKRPKGWMSHRLRRVEDLPAADRKMVLRFIDGLVARQNTSR